MRYAHRPPPVDNRKRLPTVERLCPQAPPPSASCGQKHAFAHTALFLRRW